MKASYYQGLACIRCGTATGDERTFEGCRRCAAEGVVANLEARVDLERAKRDLAGGGLERLTDAGRDGVWRFASLLPISGETTPVSLGEGASPLLPLARLGDEIGLDRLEAKDESRGPTWSYKDRLATVLVTKAVELGARGVVVSSTGNHGAAIAAYAARAGLPCLVLTLASVPLVMKAHMASYGAMVVALERSTDRWVLMKQCVDALGWMPASGYVWPPLGSPPFGVEGYKTIAYELALSGGIPDVVVVPTSYGDGLYGIWKGFRELHALGLISRYPRMIAAEALGSLEETLRRGGELPVETARRPSVFFSIATPVGTYQGLAALRASGGGAIAVDDESGIGMQLRLASVEGLYAEPSSVAALVAAQRLRARGDIGPGDRVVVILTSSGLKDPEATAAALPRTPVVEPRLDSLRGALRDAYGFAM